jgi:hypothetical protein
VRIEVLIESATSLFDAFEFIYFRAILCATILTVCYITPWSSW